MSGTSFMQCRKTRISKVRELFTHPKLVCQIFNHIQDWYKYKLANLWILPSINKLPSKIAPEDWEITPNHSNYVESAHAARNAETST
jgi:hypothetical protein